MASHPQRDATKSILNGKVISHWRVHCNVDEITGDPDADYISRNWSIYADIHELTREPNVYTLAPAAKLEGCRVSGEDFFWGIPRDDLMRGLLWHAVYKPFWNDKARHSFSAPSWSWMSLDQRVGWPDYSGGRVEYDIVHVTNLVIEGIQADDEQLTESQCSGLVSSALICLTSEVFPATFELHHDTKRRGSLTGLALRKTLACTMDCDYRKRDVSVLKLLTRQLDGGLSCTHFLVLEAILPRDQPEVPDHQNVSDGHEKVSAADIASEHVLVKADSHFFRRVGTAKLNHRAKESAELRRGSRWRTRIVIV